MCATRLVAEQQLRHPNLPEAAGQLPAHKLPGSNAPNFGHPASCVSRPTLDDHLGAGDPAAGKPDVDQTISQDMVGLSTRLTADGYSPISRA